MGRWRMSENSVGVGRVFITAVLIAGTLWTWGIMAVGVAGAGMADVTAAEGEIPGALILVNERHTIEPDHVPEPLMALDGLVRVSRPGHSLRKDAGEALVVMLKALENAGHKDAIVRSAYRTYAYQKNYYDSQVNSAMAEGLSEDHARKRVEKRVALPGASEHQTGLAVDIGSTLDGLITRFHLTASGKWLAENAHNFGFILRYPKAQNHWTGFGYEPWHFRYVGLPHSVIITKQSWILEEYLSLLVVSHFMDFQSGSGVWIRVVRRDSQEGLPPGWFSIQTDQRGGWIGVYSLSHAPDYTATQIVTWLDQGKLGTPQQTDPQDEKTRAVLMDLRGLVDAMRPRVVRDARVMDQHGWILWKDGALTAAVMANPPGTRFNDHPVHLPVSMIRVGGMLNAPLRFIETEASQNMGSEKD